MPKAIHVLEERSQLILFTPSFLNAATANSLVEKFFLFKVISKEKKRIMVVFGVLLFHVQLESKIVDI